jgi:hypothetical protein
VVISEGGQHEPSILCRSTHGQHTVAFRCCPSGYRGRASTETGTRKISVFRAVATPEKCTRPALDPGWAATVATLASFRERAGLRAIACALATRTGIKNAGRRNVGRRGGLSALAARIPSRRGWTGRAEPDESPDCRGHHSTMRRFRDAAYPTCPLPGGWQALSSASRPLPNDRPGAASLHSRCGLCAGPLSLHGEHPLP